MEDRDRYSNDETAPTKVVSPGHVPPSETSHSAANTSQAFDLVSPHPVNERERLREQVYEARRLQVQTRWLKIGLATAVVVLGGTLAGVFLGVRQEQVALRNTQEDLIEQIKTLEEALPEEAIPSESPSPIDLPTVALPSGEQLKQLEEQLKVLTEQTKALSEQAKTISEQLPEVSLDQWTELQAKLATLEQDIQNNLPGEALSTRFDQLSERLRQLLNQPQAESTEPEESEPAQ